MGGKWSPRKVRGCRGRFANFPVIQVNGFPPERVCSRIGTFWGTVNCNKADCPLGENVEGPLLEMRLDDLRSGARGVARENVGRYREIRKRGSNKHLVRNVAAIVESQVRSRLLKKPR